MGKKFESLCPVFFNVLAFSFLNCGQILNKLDVKMYALRVWTHQPDVKN